MIKLLFRYESERAKIRTILDRYNAGTWLKPGAWGSKPEERNYPKRRGFRPTVVPSAQPFGLPT